MLVPYAICIAALGGFWLLDGYGIRLAGCCGCRNDGNRRGTFPWNGLLIMDASNPAEIQI